MTAQPSDSEIEALRGVVRAAEQAWRRDGSDDRPMIEAIISAILSAGYAKRDDVLEEAAKVADGYQCHHRGLVQKGETPLTDGNMARVAHRIAAQIRLRKDPK